MGIFRRINVFRMAMMRGMAKNIGTTRIGKNSSLDPATVKRVLISRPNGRLGNLLLITPLVQEVTETFPNCKIDLFVKGGLAPIIFKNYPNVDQVFSLPGKPFKNLFKYLMAWGGIKRRRYDVVINVVNYSSSGRLSTRLASSKFRFFGDMEDDIRATFDNFEHIAKYPVYNFRYYLTKLGFNQNNKPVPPLDLKLSPEELAHGKKVLHDLTGNDKKTIAIFTYATGTKKYSEEWWDAFYTRLKGEFADYNIIEVLPMENVSQIGRKAPVFYSRDIREIGGLIAATDVFIGADSGIMHLASASKTSTVGLFGISSPPIYQPYDNGSLAIDTRKSGIDDWMRTVREILEK